jgi:DeoR/GlpR family transcriptional regulator of sugar metabolism
MSEKRIDEIRKLLTEQGKVRVSDLSTHFNVSEVSVRKYLAKLEEEGFAERFYGGAALKKRSSAHSNMENIYSDPLLLSLAQEARRQISAGDTIFIGSGRSCCVLARLLDGIENLKVVTNNISALDELIHNAARVYLIGGEVTSTDRQTLFSSWESPQSLLKNIFVNKAFTSIAGLDLKAGLTVDSVISTYIFKHIPTMAHHWYMMADNSKFDKISIYPIGELNQINTLITNDVPEHYSNYFSEAGIKVLLTGHNSEDYGRGD